MLHTLLDIGANLADSSFCSDRDEVIDRAIAAGVTRMIVTGPTLEGSRAALEVAHSRPGTLFSTAGVHPHHAGSYTSDTTANLRELAAEPEVVAIGECGLDFYRDLSPRPTQIEALEAQIALASELGMPVFLHERDASEAMEVGARRGDCRGCASPCVAYAGTQRRTDDTKGNAERNRHTLCAESSGKQKVA